MTNFKLQKKSEKQAFKRSNFLYNFQMKYFYLSFVQLVRIDRLWPRRQQASG